MGTVPTAATPVIFVYWCATEAKGYNNEGVNILTRTTYLPAEAKPGVLAQPRIFVNSWFTEHLYPGW